MGINKLSSVAFHVFGVCQKGKNLGTMAMDENGASIHKSILDIQSNLKEAKGLESHSGY